MENFSPLASKLREEEDATLASGTTIEFLPAQYKK